MPKANPYDPVYIMKRDNVSYEEALVTIEKIKEKSVWNRGKTIKKSNPYDPEYVMKRDKCSLEEAKKTIQQFKEKKATNLPNFIKKYGSELGTKKYNEWKEKSLGIGHQNSKINGKLQSKLSPHYYMKLGYSVEDATKMALDYQHKHSPLHIEYYTSRGLNLDYARKKIRSIHDKKIGKDAYKNYLINTLGYSESEADEKNRKAKGHCTRENLGDEEFAQRIAKMRSSFEKLGIWIALDDLSDYELYKRQVWEHTNKNDLTVLENHEKRGRAGEIGAYQLDHRFSISRGFIEGISPELIGSIKNLQFIPWEDNLRKQGICSIELKELKNED